MAGPPEERPVRLAQQETQTSPIGPRTSRVSADGRYVVFVSSARLVEADDDACRDVYVFDRLTGRYTRESGAAEGAADGESRSADISGDGRHVVFESEAGNLVRPAFPAGVPHIYLRARDTGETRLLTTDGDGAPARGSSRNPVISADGQWWPSSRGPPICSGTGQAGACQPASTPFGWPTAGAPASMSTAPDARTARA